MRALADAAGSKDFGTILAVSKNKRFGFAARNYYASFLAVHDILKSSDKLLKNFPRKPAWSYDVVRLPFSVFAPQLEATGVFGGAPIDSLNPALTKEAEVGKVPLPYGMSLRVPKGRAQELLANLQAMSDQERNKASLASRAIHQCSGQQTVVDIAKKYGVDVDFVAAATGLSPSDVPKKGTRLTVPSAQVRTTLLPEARGMTVPPLPSPSPVLLAAATPPASSDASPAHAGPSDAAPTETAAVPVARAAAKDAKRQTKEKDAVALTSTLVGAARGRVSSSRIRVSAIVDDLPAVDVVAGMAADVLPAVDAVAGDPGLHAPWPLVVPNNVRVEAGAPTS
jgi:hypothetical protein